MLVKWIPYSIWLKSYDHTCIITRIFIKPWFWTQFSEFERRWSVLLMADSNPARKTSLIPTFKQFYTPKIRIFIHGQIYDKTMPKNPILLHIVRHFSMYLRYWSVLLMAYSNPARKISLRTYLK
jgi:hypothetical protein